MGRPLNRTPVHGNAADYQTFQITAPKATHFRPATCQEFGCLAMQKGWKTTIDEASELGQRQGHYIRKLSGRKYTESRTEAGLTVFEFECGQKCFAQHSIRLEREEIFIVKGGDYRGNPRRTAPRKYDKPYQWVDDFATHQDNLKTLHERG